MSSKFKVPGFTFQISRSTCCMLHLTFSAFSPHISRLTSHASRFPFLVSRFSFLAFFSASLLILSACGRKTTVRPPELVAPESVNDLTLEMQPKGVVLRWGRTDSSVDGEKLDDLAGFVVLRAKQDEQGKTEDFTKIATIPVEDRDRFRKNKKFSYTDEQMTVGSLYRYRVLAFTLDGYYGGTSNTVELIWRGGS